MDLSLLVHLPLALVPGLAWLLVFALRFKPDADARRLIVKIFVLGTVMCVPAGELNAAFKHAIDPASGTGWLARLLAFVLIVGPSEEALKFLIVWTGAYRRWRFKTELDGVIFASASALGFATYETAQTMQVHGMRVLLVRGWACALAHIGFSAVLGHYLGLAKARRYRAGPCIAEGLALAALLHGLYDFLVTRDEELVYPVVLALGLLHLALRRGWLKPMVAVVAPRWMEPEPRPAPAAAGYQRRRFPVQTRPPAAGRVQAALEAMESLDEEPRRRALAEALEVIDQRLYEKAGELAHDPVAGVRAEAERVRAALRKRLYP